mgnify:CR=1 FL=1
MYPQFDNLSLQLIGLLASSLLIFLAIYIFSNIKKNQTQRFVLLALTVFSTIQTLYILFYGNIPALWTNIFLGVPTVFGPLALLYTQSFVKKSDEVQFSEWVNYLPFVIIGILAFIPDYDIKANRTLHILIVVAHWGLFLTYTFFWLSQSKMELKELHHYERKWLWSLLALLAFIWIDQSLLFLIGSAYQLIYVLSIMLVAIMLSLFYFRFRSANMDEKEEPETHKKHVNAKSDTPEKTPHLPENARFYLNKLDNLVNEEKIYIDPNLTIPRLAEKMQIQPYLLSQIINAQFDKSFPDYINSYRIEDAKKLLEESSLKISSIASDCGFNSLSSFNLAFKKHTDKTPSQYRNDFLS